MKNTLEQKVIGDLESTQRKFAAFLDKRPQRRLRVGILEASQRQMWIELALLAFKAELFHTVFNAPGKLGQIRRRFDSRPQHARASRTRETSKASDFHLEWIEAAEAREGLCDLLHLRVLDMTQEFQGEMNTFGVSPARAEISARLSESVLKLGLLLPQRGTNYIW